jgi:hypothetical protein
VGRFWLNHASLSRIQRAHARVIGITGIRRRFGIDGVVSALTRPDQAGSRTNSIVEQCTPPPPFWISS